MITAHASNIIIDGTEYDVSSIKGEITKNEQLSKHTTWRVGGEAAIYFRPENKEDLQKFLKILKADKTHNILWLGLGSNVLIRDKGYNGIIINTVGKLKQIDIGLEEVVANNKSVLVATESGVSCAKFSREVAKAGLLGAEFYSGIPGSMGGAIAMNAGAFGSECWDKLVYLDTIDSNGDIKRRKKKEFIASYRHITGLKKTQKQQQEWFIKGYFRYPKDSLKAQQTKQKIKQLLEKRNVTQPIQYANAGSVFKNPKGDYAARLIQQSNLKGKKIGGAEVSHKHANFIINRGDASATDIESLIEFIQKTVAEKFSIKLQTEVKIYGEK